MTDTRSRPGTKGFFVKHGMAGTPVHLVWKAMLQRCHNPNSKSYPSYGGRGIVVCDRWRQSFTAFMSDMGQRPEGMSVERIDNDGPYSPGNCKWATASEQGRNRRDQTHITANGETMSVSKWARKLAFPRYVLQNRLTRGWSHERVINTPRMVFKKAAA